MEEWRDIPDYEGLYQVSNLGRVKSLHYKMTNKERVLVPVPDRVGYLRVKFRSKVKLVHRLVWETFVGPIQKGLEINHINEDKADNSLGNLNLVTRQENNTWGTRIEKMVKKISVPVEQVTKTGEVIGQYSSMAEAERITGVDSCSISMCCSGKRYKSAGGFIWRYAEQA